METNREHFFGDVRIADTVMLLTYQYHNRPECRLFKEVLQKMSPKALLEWLNSPKDPRFNW